MTQTPCPRSLLQRKCRCTDTKFDKNMVRDAALSKLPFSLQQHKRYNMQGTVIDTQLLVLSSDCSSLKALMTVTESATEGQQRHVQAPDAKGHKPGSSVGLVRSFVACLLLVSVRVSVACCSAGTRMPKICPLIWSLHDLASPSLHSGHIQTFCAHLSACCLFIKCSGT